MYYRRKRDQHLRSRSSDDARRKRKRKINHVHFTSKSRKRTCYYRSVKKHDLIVRDADGSLRTLRPEDTNWYILYVLNPPSNERMAKLFRLRFCIPYSSFLELSNDIENNVLFSRWTRTDAVGKSPSNMKLLLLGSLRYIGRGWTLDDIYEATGISINVNREFLKTFIEYGSSVLYKKYVSDPAIDIDVSEREKLFKLAGFDGCIGSCDATHIPMVRCAHWAQNLHKGYKLNFPARTYNVTCDHSRRILGSTPGHPGTWNDKTLILFDELIFQVHDGKIPNDYEFTLLELNKDGDIVQVPYKGVWFIVDNGYLSWSCTVPPDGNATRYDAIRFSEWLESMRKDIECLFGIMKGRFAIFRYGYRFHQITDCDRTWLTCCALHNMLLEIDGLHKDWEECQVSEWESIYRKYLSMDPDALSDVPFAIRRLNQQFNHQQEIDPLLIEDMHEYCKKYTVNGKRVVSKMPLSVFRQCLIKNFDIRFKQNKLVWPRRLRK